MPLYDLACDACDARREMVIPLADFDKPLPHCTCGGEQHRVIAPLRVLSDIEPYRAVAVDVATGDAPWITSRSQHREFLKRNNYTELGNDSSLTTPPARREEITDREIGKQIKQTIDQKGIRL